MKNIADAVGIKTVPYKHFKSKKEIFDTIVQRCRFGWNRCPRSTVCPMNTIWQKPQSFTEVSARKGFFALSEKIFLFYLKDEFASKFAGCLPSSSTGTERCLKCTGAFYGCGSVLSDRIVCGNDRQGHFPWKDPKAMAVNSYAPIFSCWNRYDQEPDKEEEALEALRENR